MKKQIEVNVSDPQADILESNCARNLFHSGVGSGKSHCIGIIAAHYAINHADVRGFIGANTYSQLSKSTLDRAFNVWQKMFGWEQEVHYTVDKIPPDNWRKFGPKLKSYDNTISFNNGHLIFTASLDNYKVIDGTEFAYALLDETKDTREEAVKEVIVARLRQPGMWIGKDEITYAYKPEIECHGYNPLYIFTSPAKTDWLAEWFDLTEDYEEISKQIFSKDTYYKKVKDGKLVVISSTYHNEHNLADGYIEQLLKDYKHNPNLVDMLIYGSPIAKAGNEFYNCFDRLKHVKEVPMLKGIPIHISLDFNVAPYITMTCWQIVKQQAGKYLVRAFDEICLSSPRNNTEDLCLEFERRWGTECSAGLFYYGDYSGKNRQTVSKEAQHNFDVLEKVLRRYITNHSDRVVRNPPVVKRRDFVNKTFNGGNQLEIVMDAKCKHLIADMEFLREDVDGTKLKQKVRDPNSGQSYEKYGHTSDTLDYFICGAFEQIFYQ